LHLLFKIGSADSFYFSGDIEVRIGNGSRLHYNVAAGFKTVNLITGFCEISRQLHRKTTGMRRDHKFFGIGTDTILKTRLE
jgi:hypothetical protein